MSADTIAPGKGNPQNRNRYSYGLNNPIHYTDPSGYCAEGYDEDLAGCTAYLNDHGWASISGAWTYEELDLFVESVFDLKQAAGWSMSDYRKSLTGNGAYKLELSRQSVSSDDPNRPADTQETSKGVYRLRVFDAAFASPEGDPVSSIGSKGVFVHEQAHVWDYTNKTQLSNGLLFVTQGSYNGGVYTPRGRTATAYGQNGPAEDWAETVMAAVYPEHPMVANYPGEMSSMRRDYARVFLPKAPGLR